MTTPIMGAFSMEKLEKEERATASSLMVTSWQICWAITSNISGNLMRGGDYTMPYIGAIIIYIFTGAAVWILFSKQE
jgi:predicted MFS family arabinose efflux permease